MPDLTVQDDWTGEDVLMCDIGRRLRCAMIVRRVGGRELGRALSVTGATVSRWQAGRQRMGIGALNRAASVLRVPAGWLIGGEPLDTGCEYLLSRLRGEMVMMAPAQREAVLMTVMDEVAALAFTS